RPLGPVAAQCHVVQHDWLRGAWRRRFARVARTVAVVAAGWGGGWDVVPVERPGTRVMGWVCEPFGQLSMAPCNSVTESDPKWHSVMDAGRRLGWAAYALNASWLSVPTRVDVYRGWSRVIASWRSKHREVGEATTCGYLLIVDKWLLCATKGCAVS